MCKNCGRATFQSLLSLFFFLTGLTGSFAAEIRWADSLIGVSSQYSSPDYGGVQATGVPDVYPEHEDSEQAWASLTEDGGREYIELGYSDPIQVQTISIFETYNPGAVDKVLLRNASNNQWIEVWAGTPSTQAQEARVFSVSIPRTSYQVNGVRVELASSVVLGWNEIDAVAIIDGPSDEIGPSISEPDISGVPVLYPELADEAVEIEVDVQDYFNGVATVTMQFFGPDNNPVGDQVEAVMDAGEVENGTWLGQPAVPRGSESGSYGIRIVATGEGGDATTLDLFDVVNVVERLPRPGNLFAYTKIAETGDFAHTYPALSYDIASFENAPVMNNSGVVAFEVNLVNDLGGGGVAIMTGDGVARDTIAGDGDIRYVPDVARRSGRSMAINDSGWVAFKGYQIGQGGISAIYKTDGSTIVEIDSIGSSASISPPIGNAWINNAGDVVYYKYNETSLKNEVFVGDGTTSRRIYGIDDVLTPDWYAGMAATGPVGKRITNIGMEVITGNGDVLSNITLRDVAAPNRSYHAILRVTPSGDRQFERLAQTGANQTTYFYSFNHPVLAASPSGRYAFVAGAIPGSGYDQVDAGGRIDFLLRNTIMLVTNRGVRASGLGFGARVFGNPPIDGPSINDIGVLAYFDGGDIPEAPLVPAKRNGIRIKSGTSPVELVSENDLLDGRRVKSLRLSRQAINNSNQVVFLAEFFDGHQGIYRADPALPQVLPPVFPTIETLDPIGGTVEFTFDQVDSGEFLKLPNSPEIQLELPGVGDRITQILGMTAGLADPVEVLVEGVPVGQFGDGESFDIAAVSGGGASSITLRGLFASPSFGGSLGIALEFNRASAEIDVSASTAPLLVRPYSFPLIAGAQAIVGSGSVERGEFTYQWFRNDVELAESSRVIGVDEGTLQINPVEPADAARYTLIGTGPGNQFSSIDVDLVAGQTFAEWIAEFYPGETNPLIVDAGANPSGDGLSNIVKFMFAMDPTVGLSADESDRLMRLSLGHSGGKVLPQLNLAIYPAAAGVSIVVETSESLSSADWQALDMGSVTIVETLENGVTRYQLRLPESFDPAMFFRVSIREAR